jgi:hypothetical protein
MAIPGGVFLPDANIPDENLTANLGPGTITYSAYDLAYDAIGPEPSSVSLFVTGVVGLVIYGCRRHRGRWTSVWLAKATLERELRVPFILPHVLNYHNSPPTRGRN